MTAVKLTWTDQERVELQRKCVDEHMALENGHHVDRVLPETFATDDVWYDIVPTAEHLDGLGEIQKFYDDLFATLPDIKIRVTHEYDVPGCCVREGVTSGTHSAEFLGIPASGNFVAFPFVAMYIFGDDPTRLVAERAYWDNDMLMRQFKGELEARLDYPWNTGQ